MLCQPRLLLGQVQQVPLGIHIGHLPTPGRPQGALYVPLPQSDGLAEVIRQDVPHQSHGIQLQPQAGNSPPVLCRYLLCTYTPT